MSWQKHLEGESDCFIGRRGRLRRTLVCALQGFFPVLARTGPQSLAVVFRTGATHVGISGTVAVATSADSGLSWSDPVEVAPRWDDNRNPAFGVNAAGELVCAFWRAGLHNYEPEAGTGNMIYTGAVSERQATIPALYYALSSDQGRTWSEAVPYQSTLLTLASPYGRILQAPDGTLLMPVYGGSRGDEGGDTSILLRSTDAGRTWGDESIVVTGHNESSFAFLPDGTMLAALRSQTGHVAVARGDAGGREWTTPVQVTREGEHPADITVLQSGRVLLTFGRRIRPMGCGALLSEDNGETWNHEREVLLAGDGIASGDLGYPSTVQLADGRIVTVLYYASGSEMSVGFAGWGDVSCQAIHYREDDIL